MSPEGRPAKPPPKTHLRKMRRRMELLGEAAEPVLREFRTKQTGPRRLFIERYDLVMHDFERMLNGMLDPHQ